MICFSFSGPSSSGKSEIIAKTQEYFLSKGFTVYIRGSLSRKYMDSATTLEDRKCPEFQKFLLSEAVSADSDAFNSGADIILADRTILDGYIYFREYQTASDLELSDYFETVKKVLRTYTHSFLLPSVVFKEDDVRKEFDKDFSDKFFHDFVTLWPEESSKLSVIQPQYGIDKLFEQIETVLFPYSRLKKGRQI